MVIYEKYEKKLKLLTNEARLNTQICKMCYQLTQKNQDIKYTTGQKGLETMACLWLLPQFNILSLL